MKHWEHCVVGLTTLLILIGIAALVPNGLGSLTFDTVHAQTANKGTPSTAMPSVRSQSLWGIIKAYDDPLIWALVVIALIIVLALLLYRTTGTGADPLILRFTPSFFFWLGMTYILLLLLLAATYDLVIPTGARPILLGGILPVAVPWFGALGAVTISLEGVFLWNNQWDKKFNYWHIGRPLFGAVLGIVAFFLFVVIVSASGSAPKFLEDRSAPGKDYIIFYVVAFLVGYREETFRDLIKRATDLILKPGTSATTAPAVVFKVGGTTQVQIQCPNATVGGHSSVTVEIQNSGTAPLVAPVVGITAIAPTPAGTFATVNDHVSGGGDLLSGQTRNVDVTFTPGKAGAFGATLSLTATNLSGPKTIGITGVGT